jgi:flagellar basal-body rod protein FlgC
MSLFQAIGTAASSLTVQRTWMDAISDNIANVNTVRPWDEAPFQARMVVAQAVGANGGAGTSDGSSGIGRGTSVVGIALDGSPEGRIVYDPSHPFANDEGLVRQAEVDLGDQMVQLLTAQRAYQANLAVVERARDAYQAALQIGR